MLKSSLRNYSDVYILVKGTITVSNTASAGQPANNNGTEVLFKNCAPFTNCISEINHEKIDNAQEIDVVVSIYNLIGYSDSYSKTSDSLWQYYRDEPSLNDAGVINNFPGNSALFKCKQKITDKTGADCTKDVEIMVTLKYFCSN